MVWRKAASFDAGGPRPPPGSTRSPATSGSTSPPGGRPAIETEDWLTVFAPEEPDADKSVSPDKRIPG